jgi:hypothetical protein
MRGFLRGIKRFILWDYPRACWQYDVMVGLILAFIFLTPKGWFHDQVRTSSIVILQAHEGMQMLWIAPELLAGVPEQQRKPKAAELLQKRFGQKVELLRFEPISNAESEIQGYMALAKP